MYWNGKYPGCDRRSQRTHSALVLVVTFVIACGLACSHTDSPQAAFEQAHQDFLHGNLQQAQDEAEQNYRRFQNSNPGWASKFTILQAETLLWRGMSQQALDLLDRQMVAPPQDRNLQLEMLSIQAVAHVRVHSFSGADRNLAQGMDLCAQKPSPVCGEVIRAAGILALERGELAQAHEFFSRILSLSRASGDHFLETSALLNLGAVSLKQSHFDEAVDWAGAANRSAADIDAGSLEAKALDNLGWAYYNLGDWERSLDLFKQTEKRTAELGNVFDEENALTNIGYVYMDQHNVNLASQSFKQALQLAESINAKQDIYNALRVLARLSVQTGNLNNATNYVEQALNIARESGNQMDELYPRLVQGKIAAQRGDRATALQIFKTVEQNQLSPSSLKWEAQHSLALLYEGQNQSLAADREFRAALSTVESAREGIGHEDSRLSFLTNGVRIYDDYIHFLVAHGKPDDALRWADYSRARTLSEGLGLLAHGTSHRDLVRPPFLKAQDIAQRAQGIILFYWLGERQSYLWAISAHQSRLLPLSPGVEIDSRVLRYRKALAGPQDVLELPEGRALYDTLIAPARQLLMNNSKVFIIPDGSLNNLNFETLIVSEPKPHFWIEDANIVDASSLHVLATSSLRNNTAEKKQNRSLLLFGDSVAPSKEYPELPKAAGQMSSVSKYFPTTQQQVYRRERATPAAYLASNPSQFSYIHFVAHGTASRLSPLDSAIVLSRDPAQIDSFKLYARDIIGHPLQADLVTISACYSAGDRFYSGEGLVGLAWAFLRAGAHNVIAGLWEVTDASTEQLMDSFYEELNKGNSPDLSLRKAKLSLLHGNTFRSPFYWAPFQLYTGS
jgi:CHAT domain-containing protein/Tfp pilus assembly protein PilF